MAKETPKDIGQLLVEKELISTEALAEVLSARTEPAQRIDRLLIESGQVTEEQFLAVLGEHLDIQVVELSDLDIDPELMRQIPTKLIHRRNLVPVGLINGSLRVATSNPLNVYALDELRMLTGLKIEPLLARQADIERVIREQFGVGGETLDELSSAEGGLRIVREEEEQARAEEMAQEASVIRLVNEIIIEAVKQRASDVHIEPFEKRLSIRYRIDGVLHNTRVSPQIQRFSAAIISRLKIMSQLNIAEKRLPQDGAFKMHSAGRDIDVRVSIIPMLFGEGVVLRLLDKSALNLTLGDLGMGKETLEIFASLIERPHGILLVTGPTGSGKTTTLYSALGQIVSEKIKVITVEDPIEYQLAGVNQIQVLPKIGMTFARGLRSILRHDPDVIMIGEIRDLETAEAAVQASLTGHLVFSTLHTNDAAGAPTRLLDMGVEPFLVASSVEAVLAQRLVRRTCPDCSEAYEPDPNLLPRDFPYEKGLTLQRGRGCQQCRQTGYRGRVGIFELLTLSEPLRELIMLRAGATKLLSEAKKEGLIVLREDGWQKVLAGRTTPEEVLRATKG